MSAEDHRRAGRHFIEFLDEHRAALAQVFDHKTVVHHFVAHIDRRTEGFQRAAYDAGISGYLTKPIDLDRMHQLIARLLSPTGSGNLASS